MNPYEAAPGMKRPRMKDNTMAKQDYDENEHAEPQSKFSRNIPPSTPNKVLLFTIINAVYPITTKVMESICKESGDVQRIVIFRKRGVQAMVEFDSVQSAQHAKASLNGADIYSGCCTLKIEYARPTQLNVYKNDNDTWDYTGALDADDSVSEPLLGDAPVGYEVGNYGGMGMPPMGQRPPMHGMGSRPRPPMGVPGMRGRGGMMHHRPRAMMAPSIQNQIPEYDFSLDDYGQNSGGSVKFLKSKPGTAMVQMGDPMSVDRAIHNLSGVQFFGEKLVLAPSKQMYLTDSGQIGELEDKTPSFVDFSGSKNNRFTTTEQAAKNRIQKPALVLHYFNAPVELDEDKVQEMCDEFSVASPVKFTPFKSRSDRSSSGLLEFADKSDALECLTMLNHYKLENPSGRYPYVFKLCFSTSSSSSNY